MKPVFRFFLIGLLGCTASAVWSAPSSMVDTDMLSNPAPIKSTETEKNASKPNYKTLPTYFIKNTGQLDQWVAYYEKGMGHTVFFSKKEVIVLLNNDKTDRQKKRPEILKFTFLNANPNPEIMGEYLQVGGKVNYSINGKVHWKSNIPAYKIIRYKDIYPGIDVKFYGRGQIFEYDFIVKKGADPSLIEIAVQGAQGLSINQTGDMVISLRKGELIKKKPIIYQMIGDQAKVISGNFIVNDYTSVAQRIFPFSFELAEYNPDYPLTIDPILDYHSYLKF